MRWQSLGKKLLIILKLNDVVVDVDVVDVDVDDFFDSMDSDEYEEMFDLIMENMSEKRLREVSIKCFPGRSFQTSKYDTINDDFLKELKLSFV